MRSFRSCIGICYLVLSAHLAACGNDSLGRDAALADAAPSSGLLGLALSSGRLSPDFSQSVHVYTVEMSVASLGVPLTVTPTYRDATVTMDGVPVPSGTASPEVSLHLLAPSTVDIAVTPIGGGEAVHVAIVVPARQEVYGKASNTRADAHFGHSVALSRDTLIVGAPDESSKASGVNGDQIDQSLTGAGAVYVFARSGTTWSQQAYLKASNPRGGAHFGSAVAISGDTLVVAANQESSKSPGINGDQSDASLPGAGAVYVFTRSGSTWSQQAYVKASNPMGFAMFGYSVAVLGDTLAVGAIGDRSSATGINGSGANANVVSGAAYVFTRSGTIWSQQAYVKASNTGVGASFGLSIALAGDTMVVGADGERSAAIGINGDQTDTTAPNAGAAYVFTRSGTTWSQQAYLKASNTRRDANFGHSVAMFGETLAVGSYLESSGATGVDGDQSDTSAAQAGAVYMFERTGTEWRQRAYIKASNTRITGSFGNAVALEGNTLVVGGYGDRSNAIGINGDQSNSSLIQSGAVYVFERNGATWSQRSYLKASNNGIARAYFGWSLALSEGRLAVGSWGESSNATGINGDQTDRSLAGAGAVYLLR